MLTWKPEEIEFDRSEILRYLGYGSEKGKVSSRTSNMLEEEIERALSLISPRACYRVVKKDKLNGVDFFHDAERVAFSIATIGSGLENKVKNLFEEREGIRALLLDATGTVAARKTSRKVYQTIYKEAVTQGYHLSGPLSPGHGAWGLDGQKYVFHYLQENTIKKMGVSLTPSLLINPLKSLSFAVKLGWNMAEDAAGGCTDCSMEDKCAYRRCQLLAE